MSYRRCAALVDAYLSTHISLDIKPEEGEGLILFNGKSKRNHLLNEANCSGGENAEEGDFISLGLREGRLELRSRQIPLIEMELADCPAMSFVFVALGCIDHVLKVIWSI